MKKTFGKAATALSVIGLLSTTVTPLVSLADELSATDHPTANPTTTKNSTSETEPSTETTTTESQVTTSSSTTESTTIPSSETTTSSTEPTTSTTETTSSSTTEPQASISTNSSSVPSAEPAHTPTNQPQVVRSTTTTAAIAHVEAKQAASYTVDATTSLAGVASVAEVAKSESNNFELPVLTTFNNQKQAAFSYQALKMVGTPFATKPEEKAPAYFSKTNFIPYLFQTVLNVAISDGYQNLAQAGAAVSEADMTVGDLVFWDNTQTVGFYLGQGKYLYMDTNPTDKEPTNRLKIQSIYDSQKINEQPADYEARKQTQKPTKIVRVDQTHSQLTSEGQKLIDTYPVTMDFKENEQTKNFILSIGESARNLGQKYDLFASVMIAQAILESGSGTSGLAAAPYYNLFGMKGSNAGRSITMNTQEDDGKGQLYSIQSAFRAYSTPADSLADYVKLMKNGIDGNPNFYQPTWRSEAKNYLTTTNYLTGHYATDTMYNNKINSIIATYHLTQYDEEAITSGEQTLDALNALRKEHGLAPVAWDPKLAEDASVRAAAINAVGGGIPNDHWTTFGEVLAIQFAAGKVVIDAWYNETNMVTPTGTGHRDWELNPNTTRVGFGYSGTVIVGRSAK